MHVLSTPPAFVLSQDQTLHRDLGLPGRRTAPEDLRSVEEPPSGPLSPSGNPALDRHTNVLSVFLTQCIDLVNAPNRRIGRARPHWLLITTVPFSRSGGPGDGGTHKRGTVHLAQHTSPHRGPGVPGCPPTGERPCQYAGPVGDLRLPAGNRSNLALPGPSVKPAARSGASCTPYRKRRQPEPRRGEFYL